MYGLKPLPFKLTYYPGFGPSEAESDEPNPGWLDFGGEDWNECGDASKTGIDMALACYGQSVHFLIVGGEVRAPRGSADDDRGVVVANQQPALVEVEGLLSAVGVDLIWKVCVNPERAVSQSPGFDGKAGKQEWDAEVNGKRITEKVDCILCIPGPVFLSAIEAGPVIFDGRETRLMDTA
jgi:hypothetical protein